MTLLKLFAKLYVHFFVKISTTAKCPACGARKRHTIMYSGGVQHVMHTCAVCAAMWAERCLVAPAKWGVNIPAEVKRG